MGTLRRLPARQVRVARGSEWLCRVPGGKVHIVAGGRAGRGKKLHKLHGGAVSIAGGSGGSGGGGGDREATALRSLRCGALCQVPCICVVHAVHTR